MFRVLEQPRRWVRGATLLIAPAAFSVQTVSGVSVSPNPVTAGSSATGTVSITSHIGTVTVALASSNATIAKVPSSVSIGTKSSSASFAVGTVSSSAGCPLITASIGQNSQSTMLLVNPIGDRSSKLSLRLTASVVAGGSSDNATLTLIEPLGTGPLTVNLASSNPAAATVPTSVTLPAGTPNEMGIAVASATFTVHTAIVGATTCAVITATQGTNRARMLLKIVTISG